MKKRGWSHYNNNGVLVSSKGVVYLLNKHKWKGVNDKWFTFYKVRGSSLLPKNFVACSLNIEEEYSLPSSANGNLKN